MVGLAACALIVGGAGLRAGAQSGDPVPRFGVIDVGTFSDAAAELGAGWERVTFEWAAFQPGGPAEFDTESVLPERIAAAAEAGREVVGLIVGTPAWASEAGTLSAVPEGLDLPPGDPGNVWAQFVGRLAAVYGPLGVHRWIIYDEPDVGLGEGVVQFAGSVDDYARLLYAAHQAATRADPEAQLHVAALRWWTDRAAGREPYLTRLVRAVQTDSDAGQAACFDVVTLRVLDRTQAVWDIVTAARAILDAAGLDGVPIWLETNAQPTLDGDTSGAALFGITPQQQADFVVQAVALALAAGVERVGVRLADDADPASQWGLLRADGSRRPAFEAYRQAIALFASAQVTAHATGGYAELVILDDGEHDLYVLWARDTAALEFIVTAGQTGEEAALSTPGRRAMNVRSSAIVYPAGYLIDGPAARRDANGFLTVAGSPRVLALPHSDFVRVVYVVHGGETFRLR